MFLSFCIISIGDKPDITNMAIKSIHNNFESKEDYEIIIVGNNIDVFKGQNVKIVEDTKYKRFLGARRNIGTQNSNGDIIIHCDDDVLFPADWFYRFKEYDKKNPDWQILGNKFLLPDGGRHWDRATYHPNHVMVPYDYESDSDTFYQSGGFSVCKRKLLDKACWSDDIPFYGMFKGLDYNEDVEFSIRLKKLGIPICFDKDNTVWHYDYSYYSNGFTCNKKQNQHTVKHSCLDFIILMESLS